METITLSKVLVAARIENLEDLFRVEQDQLAPDQVRHVEVTNALADTGAMMLSLPRRLIEHLGLKQYRTRQVKTSSGYAEAGIYAAVRLTIQGRDCHVDVASVHDECPVLVGQVPLELLDFVVDPVNRCLCGNPEHGGQHMVDIL